MKKDGITSFVVKKGSSRRYRRFGGNGFLALRRTTDVYALNERLKEAVLHGHKKQSIHTRSLRTRLFGLCSPLDSIALETLCGRCCCPVCCTALARANSLYFVLLALATLEACFTTPAAAAVARRSCSSVYNFQRATLERETDRELELC